MRWRRRKFSKAIRGAVDFEPLLVASGQRISLLQENRFPGGPASPPDLIEIIIRREISKTRAR